MQKNANIAVRTLVYGRTENGVISHSSRPDHLSSHKQYLYMQGETISCHTAVSADNIFEITTFEIPLENDLSSRLPRWNCRRKFRQETSTGTGKKLLHSQISHHSSEYPLLFPHCIKHHIEHQALLVTLRGFLDSLNKGHS